MDDGKIVWILGAGFSRSLGAPLLNEVFSERSAARIATIYGPRMQMNLDTGAAAVHRIPLIYEAGKKDGQWANPEEFLERLDLALENKSAEALLKAWSMNATGRGLHGLVQASIRHHRDDVARVFAAECCLFLKDVDPELERWSPYLSWAKSLGSADAIITFNYDRVLEVLSGCSSLLIPIPHELPATHGKSPVVLKMHGSVDWLLDNGMIRRAQGTGMDEPNEAALFCPADQIALGTPGPPKYRLTRGKDGTPGPLSAIWDYASSTTDPNSGDGLMTGSRTRASNKGSAGANARGSRGRVPGAA